MKWLIVNSFEKIDYGKLLCLFFLGFSFCGALAQPGFRVVGIPNSQNRDYLNSNYDRFEIDSNTIFSNLKYLAKCHSIRIIVKTKILPREFHFLSDSLKEITIEGSDQLFDISALAKLKNLESITIKDYAGKSLPDLAALTKLKSFRISKYYGGDKLKSISGLKKCQALRNLFIQSGSLEDFDLDIGGMNIEKLEISRCSSLTNINRLSNSKTLKTLLLENFPLKSFPKKMNDMGSLEVVRLFAMTELTDISNLRQMKNLRKIIIYGASKLVEIPKNFSENTQIDTIDISYSRNLRSAEGIVNLNHLSFLTIEDVNEDFTIPSDISSCTNLQSIKIDININTVNQVKDISMIKNLIKLKRLYLGRCPFVILPGEIYTNVNIEDLTIYANRMIIDLSGLSNLKNLKKLEIMFNDRLKAIPGLNQMLYINNVRIHDNKSLIITDDHHVDGNWFLQKNGFN